MRYINFSILLSILLFLPFGSYGVSSDSEEKIDAPSETAQIADDKGAEKKKEKSKKGNFARGAKLWSRTCANCHNMREPKDLNDRGWEMVVMHMRIRAGLTGQDTRDILAFLKRTN